MNAITRRTLIAALPFAGAVSIPGIATASDSSPLLALIEAHKEASRRFDIIAEVEDEADLKFTAAHKDDIYIGPFKSGWDMRMGEDWVQEQVSLAIHRQCERMAAIYALNQELGDQVMCELHKAAIDQKAKVTEAFAKVEQEREECGLNDLKRQWEAESDAFQETLHAICSYRCETVEEHRVRAEYLSTCDMSDMHHRALLRSTAGREMA